MRSQFVSLHREALTRWHRRDELRAERAELTRARAQLEADVAEFERWRSDTLKLIAAQRALLSTSF